MELDEYAYLMIIKLIVAATYFAQSQIYSAVCIYSRECHLIRAKKAHALLKMHNTAFTIARISNTN